MGFLQFYDKERDEFPLEHKIIIPPEQVKILVNKLVRHYKLPKVKVEFSKRNRFEGAYRYRSDGGSCLLKFCMKGINLSIIVHEVAHHYQRIKQGKTGHNKRLMTVIRRITKYCVKMNYWGYDTNEY